MIIHRDKYRKCYAYYVISFKGSIFIFLYIFLGRGRSWLADSCMSPTEDRPQPGNVPGLGIEQMTSGAWDDASPIEPHPPGKGIMIYFF